MMYTQFTPCKVAHDTRISIMTSLFILYYMERKACGEVNIPVSLKISHLTSRIVFCCLLVALHISSTEKGSAKAQK